MRRSPERAEYYFGLSGLVRSLVLLDQGRRAPRLPLAIIFRAFGAVGLTLHRSLALLALFVRVDALLFWIDR